MLETFEEKEFVSLQDNYSKLVERLDIGPLRGRFKQAFDAYSRITREMAKAGTQIVPEKDVAVFRYAMYDLSELRDIYAAIESYPDEEILKDKLSKMNGGSQLPSEENSANSIGRDTQFELKLFSDLRDAGVRPELKEPRPDIEIQTNDYTYAIECKRIFSMKDSKVAQRVSDARDQLNEYFKTHEDGIGIIALDISRRLTGGDKYLRAPSADYALTKLSTELDEFRKQFAKSWQPSKLKTQRIVAILLYSSMYSYLEENELASHAQQITIQNTWSDPGSKFIFNKSIEHVFKPLSVKKTGRLNIINED